MANINLPPGSDYLMGALPSGVNQPAPTQVPAPNPPPQATTASNPSTHFSQLASPLEPGVTVHHYEFYTTITISLVHGNQEVVRKQGTHGTIKLIVMCTPLDASIDAKGYLKIYNAAPAPTRIENLAKGITKEHRPNFAAWIFDNTVPHSMGCFLMNHEQTIGSNGNKSTSLTFGLIFTTDEAKRASATAPPGGFAPTPSERDMTDKRWRIYRACQSQRDGTLQDKRCTQCQKKDSRECRKLEGATHCTWCVQLGQTCELEKGAAKRAGQSGAADGHNSGSSKNDDEDDDEKPKKKPSRRRSSKNPLKDFIDDEPIIDDDENQPKETSSRRSSKHKLDDDEICTDNSSSHPHSSKRIRRRSSVAAPQLEIDQELDDDDDIEKLRSKKGYWRPQIQSDSDNETSHRHERQKVRRTSSRPSLGALKPPDTAGHKKLSSLVGKKPSAPILRRPSTTTPAAPQSRKPRSNDNSNDEEKLGPTGRLLADRDAKKVYFKPGYINGDPNLGYVKAPDMARSMAKFEYGPGRSYPGYKPVVMSDKAVTREMAGRLVGVKRKSAVAAATPPAAEVPAEKEKNGEGEKGHEAEGDAWDERLRGGGDDDDELEKSLSEVDLGEDWA